MQNDTSHPGELAARQRFDSATFDSATRWTDTRLARFYRRAIDDATALWIESLPFFFIATADAAGRCDCSYRGCDSGPLLKVRTPGELVFPDYPGNGLYNSLGNLLVNAHIGLLFIDFAAQTRLRFNGAAAVVELDDALRALWPRAQCAVRVTVSELVRQLRAAYSAHDAFGGTRGVGEINLKQALLIFAESRQMPGANPFTAIKTCSLQRHSDTEKKTDSRMFSLCRWAPRDTVPAGHISVVNGFLEYGDDLRGAGWTNKGSQP